ncbi:hypothetical protein Hdeb2414_s0002g00068851 [Helianthus debilis subsp. tardiflorus]
MKLGVVAVGGKKIKVKMERWRYHRLRSTAISFSAALQVDLLHFPEIRKMKLGVVAIGGKKIQMKMER